MWRPGLGKLFRAAAPGGPFDTADIEEARWTPSRSGTSSIPPPTPTRFHLHLIGFQAAERQAFDFNGYLLANCGTEELMETDVGHGPWPPPAPDSFLTGPVPPRGAFEAGWKDSVQVHPGHVTHLLVPFRQSTAPGMPFGQEHKANPLTGDYQWHCHILDHEDNDMMLLYKVIPKVTP